MRLLPVTLPPEQFAVNRALWLTIGAVIAFNLLMFHHLGLTLDIPPAVIIIALPALFFALGAFLFRYVFRNDEACLLANVTNQILCLGIAGDMLSYLGARLNFPLIDGFLARTDLRLGFDWVQYASWVQAHPLIARSLSFSYQSYSAQTALGTLLLFWARQSAQLQRFIIALCFTGLVTIGMATLWPAFGENILVHSYYNPASGQMEFTHSAAQFMHQSFLYLLTALRNHTLTAFPCPAIGIITFPSLHAATAVLLIYAGWPLRWLRPIIIPLNIAMLLATPVDGGHYLTDVLAGIPIALLGIWLAGKCLPKPPAARPAPE